MLLPALICALATVPNNATIVARYQGLGEVSDSDCSMGGSRNVEYLPDAIII